MKVSEEKQAALRAAMERLLAGAPERSDGKLDVATLAREAGVSRATANRAAAVLAEFRRRVEERRAAEDPARTVREENAALKRELAALRQQRHREGQELRAGLNTLAQRVQALALENDELRAAPGRRGRLRVVPAAGEDDGGAP